MPPPATGLQAARVTTRAFCARLGDEVGVPDAFASVADALDKAGLFHTDVLVAAPESVVDAVLLDAVGDRAFFGYKATIREALNIDSFGAPAPRRALANVGAPPQSSDSPAAADEECAAAASPHSALVLAHAKERGRPEARAARRAAMMQLEAEADKWAPGSAAVQALAAGFLHPDADARLVVSPARLPAAAHLRCPAGHALTREAAGRPLRCDIRGCGVHIAADAWRLACAECDYDVCENCMPCVV